MVLLQRQISILLWAVALATAASAVPSIARWQGNKTAAFSLTFDDNHIVQVKYALQEMDKRKVRGTFYIVTWNRQPDGGWYRPDWTQLTAAAARGHEIGGHSCTHSNVSAEVKPCIDTLKKHFPSQSWFTWAYPGGDNLAMAEVAKYTIAARSWNNEHGIESADPPNYYNVKAINGWGNPFPQVDNKIWIQAALSSGGWGVETIHCIAGPGEPCDLALTFQAAQFGAHLDTILRFQDRLWIAPFGDVVRYAKQRRCATVSVVSMSADSIRMTLADTLSSNAIYNIPLTIKLPLPTGWTACAATQAGLPCSTTIKADTALIDAVPDAGEIIARRKPATVVHYALRPAVESMRIHANGTLALVAARDLCAMVIVADATGRVAAVHRTWLRSGQTQRIVLAESLFPNSFYAVRVIADGREIYKTSMIVLRSAVLQ